MKNSLVIPLLIWTFINLLLTIDNVHISKDDLFHDIETYMINEHQINAKDCRSINYVKFYFEEDTIADWESECETSKTL